MDTKKYKALIGVLAALSLASLVYLYFQVEEAGDMWPSENKPGSLTANINNLQTEITRLRGEVAKIKPAEEQLAIIRADHDIAVRVLPKESSMDQLVAAIGTKAQQSGVFPSSLKPDIVRSGAAARGKKVAGGNFETLRFTLSIDGSYDQIATFVNRMEEFDSTDAARMASEKRFFEVREITITAAGQGLANLEPDSIGEPVRHKCDMIMQTYRYTGE